MDRDRRAALEEVQVEHFVEQRGEDARQVRKVKFKLHDEQSALDMLARHLGNRRKFESSGWKGSCPDAHARLPRKLDLDRRCDIMHAGDEIPLVSPDARMSDAILVMTAKSFGCVGVCDSGGRLIGVITDGDLRRHMGVELLERTVAEVMHRKGQPGKSQPLHLVRALQAEPLRAEKGSS